MERNSRSTNGDTCLPNVKDRPQVTMSAVFETIEKKIASGKKSSSLPEHWLFPKLLHRVTHEFDSLWRKLSHLLNRNVKTSAQQLLDELANDPLFANSPVLQAHVHSVVCQLMSSYVEATEQNVMLAERLEEKSIFLAQNQQEMSQLEERHKKASEQVRVLTESNKLLTRSVKATQDRLEIALTSQMAAETSILASTKQFEQRNDRYLKAREELSRHLERIDADEFRFVPRKSGSAIDFYVKHYGRFFSRATMNAIKASFNVTVSEAGQGDETVLFSTDLRTNDKALVRALESLCDRSIPIVHIREILPRQMDKTRQTLETALGSNDDRVRAAAAMSVKKYKPSTVLKPVSSLGDQVSKYFPVNRKKSKGRTIPPTTPV
jgi:hypothetical protein